jgi:hypothetical protein
VLGVTELAVLFAEPFFLLEALAVQDKPIGVVVVVVLAVTEAETTAAEEVTVTAVLDLLELAVELAVVVDQLQPIQAPQLVVVA